MEDKTKKALEAMRVYADQATDEQLDALIKHLESMAKKTKPKVPTPEELLVEWGECYDHLLSRGSLHAASCIRVRREQLEASLKAHPRPVARELTWHEANECWYASKDVQDPEERMRVAVRRADRIRGVTPEGR